MDFDSSRAVNVGSKSSVSARALPYTQHGSDLNLHDLQKVDVGAWIAVIALSLGLAFIIGRSREWSRQQVKRATQELEALSAFHRAILAELSLEKVLEQLTRAIAPGMGFQAARVYLRQGDGSLHATGEDVMLGGSVYLEALFSESELRRQGLILLPLADATPVGAVAQCWQAPESRCTVTPRATLETRAQVCPGCENFAVLGVLAVSHFGRTPSGGTRLRDYADATALAVKNARLYESQAQERAVAQRKANELALIYEVGSEVTRAQDERSVVERLSDKLTQVLKAERIRIALRDNDQVHLVLESSAAGRTWLKRGGVASETLTQVALTQVPHVEGSVVTVPMLLFGSGEVRSMGALEVTGVTAGDTSLLTTVAATATLALGNIAELESLRAREREASALAELGRAFAAPFNRDPEGTLRRLCDAIRAYTGSACFITTLETREGVQTRTIASSFVKTLEYPRGEDNLTITAMMTGTPLLTANALESPRAKTEAEAFGAVCLFTVPLLSAERFVGALHAMRPDGFSSQDIVKLERLGQQVALVLDNLELLRSLQSESERLESVLENLAEGVLVLENSESESLIPEVMGRDLHGLGRANAAARSLLGIPERFTVPQLPAQIRASLEQQSSSLMLGGQRLQMLTKRTGDRTVVVLQDISAFEAAQRTKAEFLGVVSHELRTPLTAIIGFNELMLSGAAGALSPEQDQFLHTTLTASQNLHQTVQNLLIAANLEAGLFELHPRTARLHLKKQLERFRVMAQEKQLRFTLELPEPRRVTLDSERVVLVIENLVSNAVRYTPSGGEVRVSVNISDDTLEASVSDSGGGLNAGQEARLFQKFSNEAKNAAEGAGIALYVSNAIVQASGGRIWSENRPGEGLTMHLRVPLPEAEMSDMNFEERRVRTTN